MRLVFRHIWPTLSLSSRRAWIEIELSGMPVYNPKVALLTESVDRNSKWKLLSVKLLSSLSSRRAWIEISPSRYRGYSRNVALLTESVDRNSTMDPQFERNYRESLSSRRAWIEIPGMKRSRNEQNGRSPHGERG